MTKPARTIIVAEDDAGLNRLICRRLEKSGYETVSVLNGAEAIARALEHERALLLLDYTLPDLNARDVVLALAARGRAQPFITMTTPGDETVALEMMKQGARDYIIKTPDFVECLPGVLSQVLERLEMEERVSESETALREGEERFRQIADNIPDGLIVIEGRKISYVNQRIVNILGFTAAEIAESGMLGLVAPEDQPRVRRVVQEMNQTGEKTAELEFQVIRKDGSRRYVRARHSAGSEPGPATRRYIVVTDATDRLQAEDAVRKAEQRYRRLFEDAVEGIYQTTPEGKFISANPALAAMLGFDSPDALIAGVTDIGTQFYVDPARRLEFKRRLAETGLVRGCEVQLRRRDGQTIWVSDNVTVVQDPVTGEPYYQGSMVDITELRLARERERQQLDMQAFLSDTTMEFVRLGREEDIYALICRKLRQLADDACVIVNSYDPKPDKFRVRAVEGISRALGRAMRLTGSEPVGTVFSLTEAQKEMCRSSRLQRLTGGLKELPFNPMPAAATQALESAFDLDDIYAMTLFRGGEILGTVSIIPRRGSSLPDPNLVELLINEAAVVLQRKLAEEEVEHSREHLQELVLERTRELEATHGELVKNTRLAALGQVAGRVAHEMRSPLGVIRNGVSFLNMTVRGQLEGKPARHLEIIDQEIDKANAIITSLFDFARGEAPERKPSRLASIVAEAVTRAALPPGIDVRQKIPADLPMVNVDPRQMVQVFGNLLSNAAYALNGKGGVAIAAEAMGDLVRVSVADKGPGIKPEHLPRVFEPLFSTRPVGVGLGLTICKNYVEANQGTIEVQSVERKGTTVILTLPVEKNGAPA